MGVPYLSNAGSARLRTCLRSGPPRNCGRPPCARSLGRRTGCYATGPGFRAQCNPVVQEVAVGAEHAALQVELDHGLRAVQRPQQRATRVAARCSTAAVMSRIRLITPNKAPSGARTGIEHRPSQRSRPLARVTGALALHGSPRSRRTQVSASVLPGRQGAWASAPQPTLGGAGAPPGRARPTPPRSAP